MRKQLLVIISVALASFLTGTMFMTNYLAIGAKPNPFDSVWQAINALQLKVDALNNTVTEQQTQISELQSQVNSLNTSLLQLQERANQVKTIRFVELNETMNDAETFKDGAIFVWTPNNSTDNAILSINVYFQYRCQVVNPLQWRLVVNGVTSKAIQWLYSPTYTWSPAYMDSDITMYPLASNPNRASYTIEFQFASNNGGMQSYVRNINIILTVADGLQPSG